MNILIFLQGGSEKLLKSSLVAIEAAKQIKQAWSKQKLIGVIFGPSASKFADEALEYGLDEVLYSENDGLKNYFASSYCQALKVAFDESKSDTILSTATTTGKDLIPRLAGILDAGQASDIIAINSDKSLKRPMYAGNILADVEIESNIKCITVRQTAFPAANKGQKIGSKREIDCQVLTTGMEYLSYSTSGGDRPELGDAEIVVSGGRALKSAENFSQVIAPLADALGAAIGASRAAVDSGYAPNDWQVGQTGKVVAPNLYVAVGISGAIQHLAGMKDSKIIVALNKDPDAPIFEVANYGLVCDLFEAVPKLVSEIKKAKGA